MKECRDVFVGIVVIGVASYKRKTPSQTKIMWKQVMAVNYTMLVLSVLETKDMILLISHGAVIKYRSNKSPQSP